MRRRVVVVTGASRGLGRAIAVLFGKAGDKVVVNYQSNRERASDVVDEIKQFEGEAVSLMADISKVEQAETLINEAFRLWGSVDLLVNNAGITKDGILVRMTEQDWDDVLDTNLTGPFYTTRAVSRIMAEQRNGHIINIASIVGVQGREGQANYSSSKAALIGLTKSSAKELGAHNIRVNAVLPGFLPTEMGDKVSEAVKERVTHENCLKRISDPQEVARFIYHLSCMDNVSGQVFNLDSRIL